ncbi:hypothetical protein OAF35_06880 [Verrucomicrobiales bacterium]|nr:hypothetical protein [Verrucomicrobiales bacterium]
MRLLGPILLIILFFTSCGKEELVKNDGANFEGWYPRYNKYINDWLGEQVKAATESIKELETRSNEETDSETQKKLKDQIVEKTKELYPGWRKSGTLRIRRNRTNGYSNCVRMLNGQTGHQSLLMILFSPFGEFSHRH